MEIYLIINLLVILALMIDYVYSNGKFFLVYDKKELQTAIAMMLIPIINIYCLYKILKTHWTK